MTKHLHKHLKNQWQEPAKEKKKRGSIFLFNRVRPKDIADFTRQLATMVQARLPLIRCLEILYRQQRSERFKRIIESILDQVRGGTPLSETMRLYPNQFNVLYVNMLRVGEVSGHTAEMLMQLSDYLEKSSQLRRKVLTAMTYPMVIVIVAIAALSFLGYVSGIRTANAAFGKNTARHGRIRPTVSPIDSDCHCTDDFRLPILFHQHPVRSQGT
jgi:type II secretory pathway component PulF